MKPEYQKEMDALGLPWRTLASSSLDLGYEIDGQEMELFLNQTDSDEVAEFAVKAANSHHANLSRIEELEAQVERLRKLVTSGWEYAVDLAGEWNWKRDTIAKNIREMSEIDTFIKESEIALKETEAGHD